jgi:hypoxanthine phosphoribosyltransferase
MQEIIILNKTFVPFLEHSLIQQRIEEIAVQMQKDYATREPLFLGVLNGSFLFAADLLKNYQGTCRISFVKFTSYHGTQSSGQVNTLLGLNEDLKGQHIIILEDIVDSGLTLHQLLLTLQSYQPSSVQVASLLLKPKALKMAVSVDYCGFEVENDFLLGFGLDYNGYGRNLKHIYKLKTKNVYA